MTSQTLCAHCLAPVGLPHKITCSTGRGGQIVHLQGDHQLFAPVPRIDDDRRGTGITPPLEDRTLREGERRAPDPTNPKDMIGAQKLPLSLVPDTIAIYAAMAFAEGASKYGAYNWRAAGVRFSIYMEALRRHSDRLWNGEWADPDTKVPHLASMLACVGIIADAHLVGKLVDDRPPPANLGDLIKGSEAIVKHVTTMHADKKPHHWTINDDVSEKS